MAGQEAQIGALGMLIFAGIFGRVFLRKTGISDVLLLILAGVAVGAFLPAEAFAASQQFLLPLGAFALLMIVIEEGLSLSLSDLLAHAHKAVTFGLLSMTLSAAVSFSACHFLLGLDVPLSLLIAVIFSGVAPELLSGFLSASKVSEQVKNVCRVEAVFTEVLSVMLTLLLLSGAAFLPSSSIPELAYKLAFIFLSSAALGGLFALFWKVGVKRVEHENEHLAIIGLAALLYALCSLFGGNGVVAVFAFAFMVGNSKGASTDEVRRFQSEISFFLRTFFFIYLGALLFHSPKPFEMGLFALCISLLFAVARMMAGKALLLLEPSAREVRVADLVSSRGLTVAVLSIIAYDELLKLNPGMPFDLPLLALFVIFFTNAISAYLLMAKGGKSER